MKFQGKYILNDYLDAHSLRTQRPGWERVKIYIFYTFLGLMMAAGVWLSISGQLNIPFLLPFLIIPVVFLLFRYVPPPQQSRRILDRSKEVSPPQIFEITETGLQLTNEHGISIWPWNSFLKWMEGKDLLMLYVSDEGFLMIPKRFLSDPQQIEVIKRHLVENRIPTGLNPYWWIGLLLYLLLAVAMAVDLYVSFTIGGR